MRPSLDNQGQRISIADTWTFKGNLTFDLMQPEYYPNGCIVMINANGTYEEAHDTDSEGASIDSFAEKMVGGTYSISSCPNPAQNVVSAALASADLSAESRSYQYTVANNDIAVTFQRLDTDTPGAPVIYSKE